MVLNSELAAANLGRFWGLGVRLLHGEFQLLLFLACGAVSKCQLFLEPYPWAPVRANSLSF